MRGVTALLAMVALISAGMLDWRVGAEAAPTLPRRFHIASLPFTGILDFSFVDSRHGWALGASCSNPGTCGSIAVRATDDGGRTWRAVGAPRAHPAWVGNSRRDLHGADSIRFADLRDGWIYGSGLWSTHDGGLTWQNDRQVAAVRALTVRRGSAWAVEGWCPGDNARPCHYTLAETSREPDQWRTLVRLTGVQGHAVALARAGSSTGWILSYASFLPSNRVTSTLLMTTDGGTTWRQLPSPCGSWVSDDELAALDTRHLFVACGDGGATAMQPKSFAASQDGGRRWMVFGACHGPTASCAPTDGPGWDGHVNGLAASSPTVAWLAENRGTLIRTWDGGRSWQAAILKQRISPGDQSVGPVQFVDSLHGWVAAGPNELYRTDDGGKSWHSSVVK